MFRLRFGIAVQVKILSKHSILSNLLLVKSIAIEFLILDQLSRTTLDKVCKFGSKKFYKVNFSGRFRLVVDYSFWVLLRFCRYFGISQFNNSIKMSNVFEKIPRKLIFNSFSRFIAMSNYFHGASCLCFTLSSF